MNRVTNVSSQMVPVEAADGQTTFLNSRESMDMDGMPRNIDLIKPVVQVTPIVAEPAKSSVAGKATNK